MLNLKEEQVKANSGTLYWETYYQNVQSFLPKMGALYQGLSLAGLVPKCWLGPDIARLGKWWNPRDNPMGVHNPQWGPKGNPKSLGLFGTSETTRGPKKPLRVFFLAANSKTRFRCNFLPAFMVNPPEKALSRALGPPDIPIGARSFSPMPSDC